MKHKKNYLNFNKDINDIVRKNIINMAETLKKSKSGEIISDVTGSYTGTGINNESPEQDADDL